MTYTIVIGLGAVLGLAWVAWRAPERQVDLFVDAGLWVLLGSLLGARLAFVVVNWAYFQNHWLEAPQVWLGGLSWPGALGGGIFSLAMFAWFNKVSFGEVADGLVYLALPLVMSSWLGCWQAGCAYGLALPHVWWALPAVDEWGVWSPHWPVQLLGALSALLAFFVLEWMRPHLKGRGRAASLALLGLALLLAGLSLLRADPIQTYHGLRLDTWAALFFGVLSLPLCLAAFWPHRTPT